MTMVSKSTRQLGIVGGIVAVAVIVIISISNQMQTEVQDRYDRCVEWSSELDLQLQQLRVREDSLGGMLDFGGELDAAYLAYNQEVADYNVECAS